MIHEQGKKMGDNCSGCCMCEYVCPVQAIRIDVDDEGFRYPIIDEKKCIGCNKCESICPTIINKNKMYHKQTYYAARSKDNDNITNCTSGGIFFEVAQLMLANGGYVAGVVFHGDIVEYTLTNKLDEVTMMRGVKYVQAVPDKIIKKIHDLLKNKQYVLFTGNPCIVAGLKNTLMEDEKNYLITMDFVCHGVPSPKIWHAFCDYLKEVKGKILRIRFRSKDIGWHGFNMQIFYQDGTCGTGYLEGAFCNIYFNSMITRRSCYNCKYANFNRPGDLTMGDFWGIEKVTNVYNDEKGVSLVIINSKKGGKIFEKISSRLFLLQCNQEQCLQMNLIEPTVCPPERKSFWNDFNKSGFKYCAIEYSNYGFKYRIKKIYWRKAKDLIKKIIGRE